MNKETNNSIIQKDIESLTKLNFDNLKNKNILITGASGLIGSQLVMFLECYNRIKNANVNIYALVRNEEKAKKIFQNILDKNTFHIVVGDITEPLNISDNIDYIIHGASPTSSKYFVSNPVETINTAINGTNNILKFAKDKNIEGMVYLSSLEVYGVPPKEDVKENDYGYIDNMSVRSSYSEGKRLAECLCSSYFNEYNIPVKVARLSQTFGPGVEYNDGRVFAEFARCAIECRDIILHTEGKTLRTYCYTKDVIAAILTILLKGNNGEAYNVTNKNTGITIKEMAELVCTINKESNIKVKIEIPENIALFGYNPEMKIKLNTDKIEQLGWEATTSLENMFTNLIESMKLTK